MKLVIKKLRNVKTLQIKLMIKKLRNKMIKNMILQMKLMTRKLRNTPKLRTLFLVFLRKNV